jgi:hypothetical protein
MNEVWLPVIGREAEYAVSNLGRIKAIRKLDTKGAWRNERMLKLSTNEDGYKRVNFSVRSRALPRFVHRVVYEAFCCQIPESFEINHKNGIRDDNRPENLEAMSHADNVKYSKEVLKRNYATFGNARMTEKQRERIHFLRSLGLTYKEIGKQIGFSKSMVGNVVHGISWA